MCILLCILTEKPNQHEIVFFLADVVLKSKSDIIEDGHDAMIDLSTDQLQHHHHQVAIPIAYEDAGILDTISHNGSTHVFRLKFPNPVSSSGGPVILQEQFTVDRISNAVAGPELLIECAEAVDSVPEDAYHEIRFAEMIDDPDGLDSKDKRKFICAKCGSRFSALRNMRRHYFHECGIEPKHSCQFCPMKFKRRNILKCHVLKKHSNVMAINVIDK